MKIDFDVPYERPTLHVVKLFEPTITYRKARRPYMDAETQSVIVELTMRCLPGRETAAYRMQMQDLIGRCMTSRILVGVSPYICVMDPKIYSNYGRSTASVLQPTSSRRHNMAKVLQ